MENQSQRTYAAAEMKGEMNMLKGIPEILSPELLKVLCEMGHSARLVIADGNFPVESMARMQSRSAAMDMVFRKFWMRSFSYSLWILM